MKTKHWVTIIICIVIVTGIFCVFGLPFGMSRKDHFINYATAEATTVLGQHAIIGVYEGKSESKFTPVRDSLLRDFHYYDAIMDCWQELHMINIPYSDELRKDFFDQMHLLESSDNHILTADEQYQLASNQTERYFFMPPEIHRTPRATYESNLRTLLKDADKHLSIKCLLAESKTFIAKAKRGEYKGELFQQYEITIELPISAKVSYFGKAYADVKPNGKFPNLRKQLFKEYCKAILYKRENNCP